MVHSGVIFNRSWGSQGWQKVQFWRSWGTLGAPFRGLRVALGVHFWEPRGTPGRLWRAVGAKAAAVSPDRRSVSDDFGAQRVSRRLPKLS